MVADVHRFAKRNCTFCW